MSSTFAEFKNSMLKEGTIKRLQYARQQDRIGGRKAKLNSVQLKEITKIYKKGKSSSELAMLFDVYRPTCYRVLKK